MRTTYLLIIACIGLAVVMTACGHHLSSDPTRGYKDLRDNSVPKTDKQAAIDQKYRTRNHIIIAIDTAPDGVLKFIENTENTYLIHVTTDLTGLKLELKADQFPQGMTLTPAQSDGTYKLSWKPGSLVRSGDAMTTIDGARLVVDIDPKDVERFKLTAEPRDLALKIIVSPSTTRLSIAPSTPAVIELAEGGSQQIEIVVSDYASTAASQLQLKSGHYEATADGDFCRQDASDMVTVDSGPPQAVQGKQNTYKFSVTVRAPQPTPAQLKADCKTPNPGADRLHAAFILKAENALAQSAPLEMRLTVSYNAQAPHINTSTSQNFEVGQSRIVEFVIDNGRGSLVFDQKKLAAQLKDLAPGKTKSAPTLVECHGTPLTCKIQWKPDCADTETLNVTLHAETKFDGQVVAAPDETLVMIPIPSAKNCHATGHAGKQGA